MTSRDMAIVIHQALVSSCRARQYAPAKAQKHRAVTPRWTQLAFSSGS